MSAANWGIWGGGLNIFFRGRNVHQGFSHSPDLPLPHGLAPPFRDHGVRPWSQSPSEHEIKERPFLDLVSQTPRPRGSGRPLFAEIPVSESSPQTKYFSGKKSIYFTDSATTVKIKFGAFEGGGPCRQRGKSSKHAVFFSRGKRHDKAILKVQIVLSRNFVVIAQAPIHYNRGSPACVQSPRPLWCIPFLDLLV